MISPVLEIIKTLINSVGLMILLAFLLSKAAVFQNLILAKKAGIKEKTILAVIFGLFGILGTYTGIPIKGAIANSRAVGAIIAGILGGPAVGLGAGFIAGFHRWAIDIGGFTAFACGLSTFTEGLIGGLFHYKLKDKKVKWKYAFLIGIMAELTQMVIILIFAKPFSSALELVGIIWFPMTFANSVGIAIFMVIIESIFMERERAGAFQAQLALNIANRTLPYLRRGFNEFSAYKTARIIYDTVDVDAVSITNEKHILAHIGTGEDHHKPGHPVLTKLTKRVLKTGEFMIASTKKEIECNYEKCRLKSAVIVPLCEGIKVIGSLKLYKKRENSITNIDLQLALGLAQLFSTQLELAKMEQQASMMAEAELKALQAQINPHFLFNAINTIVSIIRTNPQKARELLIHLAEFFRKNLQVNKDFVEFEKELEHIKSYLAIEEARFGDRVKVEFDIKIDRSIMVPPLILQPIVENALKHGLLPKKEGGKVLIKAEDRDGKIRISVQDNGRGIMCEDIDKILNGNGGSGKVGLYNVNARIKSIYGDDYGLSIKSAQNRGTCVELVIPSTHPCQNSTFAYRKNSLIV